jgi:uncharacterized protein YjbJ (UPF0337 family)
MRPRGVEVLPPFGDGPKPVIRGANPHAPRCVSLSTSQDGERPMDWDRVEGNWKQIKGKIKEQWGDLTDDDLDEIAGKREQLEGKIQERYGLEKDRVRRDVDDWYNSQTW